MKRIVALSPHSDDVELGLGAYLHRLNRTEGVEAKVFVLAQGSRAFTKEQRLGTAQERLDEGIDAAGTLGTHVMFLNAAPDGSFNTTPRGDIVKAIEQVLYDDGPRVDEFFIPLPSFHTDHTITYEAAISALRPRKNRMLPRKVYAYEYPGQAWGPAPPETGKCYRSVELEDLDAKVHALKQHTTQWVAVEDAPVVGEHAVRSLAGLRGSEAMVRYAELFYLLRAID